MPPNAMATDDEVPIAPRDPKKRRHHRGLPPFEDSRYKRHHFGSTVIFISSSLRQHSLAVCKNPGLPARENIVLLKLRLYKYYDRHIPTVHTFFTSSKTLLQAGPHNLAARLRLGILIRPEEVRIAVQPQRYSMEIVVR